MNDEASEAPIPRRHDHEGLMLNQPYDGLEVAHPSQNFSTYPQAVTQSYQPSSLHSIPSTPYSTSSSQPEKEYVSPSGSQQSPQLSPGVAKRRKRIGLAVAALVAILVIIAAILSGVLGSQAARRAEEAAATQPPQPGQRIRSTAGAWNGTGLAMIYQGQPYAAEQGVWGCVYYQDWTGALTYQPMTYNGTIAPTNDPPSPIMVASPSGGAAQPVRAANGTGIGGTWFDMVDVTLPTKPLNFSHYIITYVDENNTLTDIWTNSSAPWGPWQYGNLSSKGWKAPTDNRPAMLLSQEWSVFGKEYGTGGFRLWSGSLDGNIHQYSYDMASGEWADKDVVLEDSYAYGGIMWQGWNDPPSSNFSGYYDNNTMYTTEEHGQVIYYVQHVNNASDTWPSGGQISMPVMSGKYGAINSSLLADQRVPWSLNNNVYFASNDTSNLEALSLTGLPASTSGLFAGESIQVPNLNVMAGTAFAQFPDPVGPLYTIYQDTGNSLAWATLKGPSIVQSGSFLAPPKPPGGS